MRTGSVVRAVALALPFAATACVLALLVGPGRERPTPSARVDVAGTGPWRSARLQLVTDRAGTSEPRAATVVVTRADGSSSSIDTSERGTGELTFDPPLAAGEKLRVAEGETVLLDGPLEEVPTETALVGDRWTFSTPNTRGMPNLVVEARLRHGVVAPPFPAVLEVSAKRGGQPVDAEVAFTTVTGEPEKGTVRTSSTGVAAIELTPLGVPVRISLEVEHEGDVARKSGDLPGQMGAIVASQDGASLVLTSPSPRSAAYVSVFDARGRVRGGEVALGADPDGFFRGALTDVVLPTDAVVLVTPHAAEDAARAYAWRARDDAPFCAATKARLDCVSAPELLRTAADGAPKNRAAEAARVASVRRTTTLLLSIALAVEVALVLLLARATKQPAQSGLRVGEDGLPEAPSPTDDPDYAVRAVSPWSQPGFIVILVLVAVMFGLWAWLMTP